MSSALWSLASLLSLNLAAGPEPWTQEDGVAVPKPIPVHAWSTYQVDPDALTRFQLTSHGLFSDGKQVISGSSAWSFEARAQLRLTEGISLTAVVPVGFSAPSDGPLRFAFGNLSVGTSIGGHIYEAEGRLLRIAGAFDTTIPTAPLPSSRAEAQGNVVAAMQSYEAQLYLPKLWTARLRGHVDLTIDMVTVEAELAIIPGVTWDGIARFVLLMGAAGRLSARLGSSVEPYLEASCAPQIVGPGQISPPFMVTPGVRLHIADAFDPAFFVSFNFVAPSAVMFGLDLATVLRPSTKGDEIRDRRSRGFENSW